MRDSSAFYLSCITAVASGINVAACVVLVYKLKQIEQKIEKIEQREQEREQREQERDGERKLLLQREQEREQREQERDGERKLLLQREQEREQRDCKLEQIEQKIKKIEQREQEREQREQEKDGERKLLLQREQEREQREQERDGERKLLLQREQEREQRDCKLEQIEQKSVKKLHERGREREREGHGEYKLMLQNLAFLINRDASVPERPPDIKAKSAKFYFENMDIPVFGRNFRTKCLVTGHIGIGDEVKLAHILPRDSFDPMFTYVGLDPNDRDQPRNTMLLAETLESAFNQMQISFCETRESINCPQVRERQFRVTVWDRNILNKPLWTGSQHTVAEYEDHVFSFPPGKEPFTRLLSWHAQESYDNAVMEGWISSQYCERPLPFGTPVR